MNRCMKTIVATAIAGLVAGVAHAAGMSERYETDDSFFKTSGSRCDTLRQEDLFAGLELVYNVGPNTGTWTLPTLSGSGPFVSHNSMTRVQMGLVWDTYAGLQDLLAGFVDENCKDSAGFLRDTEVTRFDVRINKRRTTAKLRLDARGYWVDMKDRERRVNLQYRAKMNMVDPW